MRRWAKARRIWALLPLTVLGLSAATPADRYQAGQIWEYHTRRGDEGSLLKIQSIESDPAYAKLAPIYHITVIGVHLGGAPIATDVRHFPVSNQTLDNSVTRLHQGPVAFPSPDEGIAEWRRAKGGVFTISVAEIIEFVDQRVRSQSGPGSPQGKGAAEQ